MNVDVYFPSHEPVCSVTVSILQNLQNWTICVLCICHDLIMHSWEPGYTSSEDTLLVFLFFKNTGHCRPKKVVSVELLNKLWSECYFLYLSLCKPEITRSPVSIPANAQYGRDLFGTTVTVLYLILYYISNSAAVLLYIVTL